MPQADDVKPYPLGEPIRKQKAETPERWEPVDGNPHMQRNNKTGKWRNIKPPPAPEQIPIWTIVGTP